MIHPTDRLTRRVIDAKKRQKKSTVSGVRRYKRDIIKEQEAEDAVKDARDSNLHQQHPSPDSPVLADYGFRS